MTLLQLLINNLDLNQAKLNAVARQLHEHPRKTLAYETPASRFEACVASTSRNRRR